MPYSKQTFSYTTGARTFTLALASGYDNESNISVFVVGELDGEGDQIFRSFTFDSEFVINVTDAIDNPSSVVILRTVSPTVFSVDFEAGADVTKRNLQLAFRQQFFLMQELLDGRIDSVDVTQEATDSAASAAASAVDAAAAAVSAAAAAASAAAIDTDALVRKDGTTAFTGTQTGIAPTSDLHLATKKYVDDVVGGGGAMLLDGSAQMSAAMLLVNAAPTLGNHATRKTYVDAADALKANLASPTFTGNPLAPTQTVGNNTTRLASTAFVVAEIAAGGANAFATALLHVRNEQTSGTAGGTFTKDAWRTRVINTILTNEISGASISSNQITGLPTGDYFIAARSPGAEVGNHKLRLYNATDATVVLVGSSEYAGNVDQGDVWVHGRFAHVNGKNLEIQQRSSSTKSSSGFGRATGFGSVEVYTEVQIWKVG